MSKVFCSLPFNSLHIYANGKVDPCCNFTPSKFNTIDNYFDSVDLKQSQEEFLKGQWPKQCTKCQHDELTGGYSFRTMNDQFESDEIEIKKNNYKITHLTIITSNVCNLKCIMCNDISSYVRGVELNKMGLSKKIPRLIEIAPSGLNEINNIDSIKTLTVQGGEPFGDKVTLQFLQKLIDSGLSKNIRLDLNTNLTLITHDVLLNLKKNFKHVIIKGSIDGVGAVNDYIRFPSNWQDITTAVALIQSFEIELIITTALSNIGLIKFHELVKWAHDNNIRDLFLTMVQTPDELSCTKLPNKLKQKLLTQFLELRNKNYSDKTKQVIESCIQLCQPLNIDQSIDDTIKYLQQHDQIRGNSFLDVFPELINYV